MIPTCRYRSTVIYLLALASLGASTASGQIHWRAGVLGTSPETPEQTLDALTTMVGEPDARHVVVEFATPVGSELREELSAAGLTLLTYLGNNAFFASLDAEKVDIDALVQTNALTNLLAVQRDWKLHPMLATGQVPDWAIVNAETEDNPRVGVYVLFHPDVPLVPDAVNVCLLHGAVVRSELHTVNGLVIELPFTNIGPLADEDSVQWIEPPLPRMSGVNDSNRERVQADIVQQPPYALNGAGVTVLVYDDGAARASHQDFGGRLTVRDASGLEDHATHVAGTVGGDGSASGGLYAGMAPGVTLESYGFEYDGSGIFLYTNPGDIEADYNEAINTHGAAIVNNSIGTNIVANGFPCDLMGDYGVTSSVIDSIVRGSLGAPFRVIWANGNERQAPQTCGAAYNTTGPPSCAKNHITVGALHSNDDSLTGFSSWGPTDDGRLKPDVSAPGCQSDDDFGVTSCSSASDTAYDDKCGTSMAAPTVTGISALLIEDFRDQFPTRSDPRNSTLKILLAQTAVDLGNPGPDYQYGFGSVRAPAAIDFMRIGNFLEDSVGQGETRAVEVLVSPIDEDLKVTLAWDDWPGTPNVGPSLVNDLDLRVFDPSNTQYFPWTLDPANPAHDAVRTQADRVNNIEQIVIDAKDMVPGVWRVEVHGFNVPLFPQKYSLCSSEPILGLQFTEAISRAYTVSNIVESPPVYDGAISRAYTLNNLSEVLPPFDEAISRAYTLTNLFDVPLVIDEAVSRAVTLTNLFDVPLTFEEAISRAQTVFIPGQDDFDGDGIPNDEDNCPLVPNGPEFGSCVAGEFGVCLADAECDTIPGSNDGFCSVSQEDTNGDGIGDACDCPGGEDCADEQDQPAEDDDPGGLEITLDRILRWSGVEFIKPVVIDPAVPTYMLTHGWDGTPAVMIHSAAAIESALGAGNANILAWDWRDAANPDGIDTVALITPLLLEELVGNPVAAFLFGSAIWLDALRSGFNAGSEGNALGDALADLVSLGTEVHFIGKSHGGGLFGRAARKLDARGVPATSLTTLDTPDRFLINTMRYVDPEAVAHAVVFYYSDTRLGGFGAPSSGSATNAHLDADILDFPVHLTMTNEDGWFPGLPQSDFRIDEIAYEYPQDITGLPQGHFSEDEKTPYEFVSNPVSFGGSNAPTLPGIVALVHETFDSASDWSGTGSILVTNADPDDAENSVVLMHEQGDASLFRDIGWPALGRLATFDYMFREPRGDESLSVYVDGALVYYDDAGTSLATSGLTSTGPLYIGGVAGTVARLTFVLRSDGPSGGSMILDNLVIHAAFADIDGDGDIDIDDYEAFVVCYSGSDGGVVEGCEVFDYDQDGDVDCSDWNQFVGAWTEPQAPPNLGKCGCPADLSGDDDVEAFDLAILLGAWGACAEPCTPGDPVNTCAADLTGDCDVEAFDLAILLGSWGSCFE